MEDEIRNEVSSITCSSDWENAGFESEAACNETLTEENIKQIIKEEQQRMCSNKVTIGPTGCERWRIIGVFNGKLKIVRNESIGKYSWDNKNTSTGAENNSGKNDWTTARLMKLLNPSDYYTVDSNDNNLGQSLYYNSVSGKCYSGQNNATVDCDFTSKGIKDNKTKNMIAETIWNLGTYNNMLVNFLPNQIYGYERGTTVYAGRPTIWRGKIGLMYLSDYGYAVDFNNCNKVPNNYDLMCANNVWLFNKSSNQFCINNESQNSDYVAFKYSSSYNFSFGSSSTSADIYPVLYLNSDIRLESGDGSKNNAYKLSA